MVICLCRSVSDRAVTRAVEDGARTLAEVQARCAAATGCGGCAPTIHQLLDVADDARPLVAREAPMA